MTTEIKNTQAFYKTEIPSDWKIKHLGYGVKIQGGYAFKSELFTNEGIPVIRISNIQENRVTVDEVCYNEDDKFNNFLVNEGDILIAMSGATTGKIGKYTLNQKAYLNQRVGRFLINDSRIEPDYVYHYFLYPTTLKNLLLDAMGGAQPNIANENIERIKIPLPPLPEQKAIASVLNTADATIQTTEKIIAQKELRKKWLMQNLLTGKIRLKGFDEEWKSVQISKLFTPVDRYIEWNENDLYNLISIRRRNGGVFFREPLFGYQIGVKKLKMVANNDFIISKRQASHGAWAVIDEVYDQAKVSDEYDTLEISDQSLLSVDFWKWYCQIPILTHYANVDSDGVHIEKSIFDYNFFKRRKVFIPSSMKEQKAIAQILQSVNTEISLLKAKAEKLREQKKGLMQQLLTGKIRLIVNEEHENNRNTN